MSALMQSPTLSLRIRTNSNKQHRAAQPLECMSLSESLLCHLELAETSPQDLEFLKPWGGGGGGVEKQTPRDLFLLP